MLGNIAMMKADGMTAYIVAVTLLYALPCKSFAPRHSLNHPQAATSSSLFAFGSNRPVIPGLSPIPKGISPFEKSLSKNLNIQAEFRQRAKRAIDAAIADDVKLMEIEFPPVSKNDLSVAQCMFQCWLNPG